MDLAIWDLPLEVREPLWTPCGYTPSYEQRLAHLSGHRLKQVAGGERAGKSRWTAMEILPWVVFFPDLYWIVGPDYDLARPEFEHLVDGLRAHNLIADLSQPKAGSWQLVTTLGAQVVTKTSTDPMTLAGKAPAGIAMVEAAQQTYEAFLRLRGRVAERRGPLLLSGTFERVNWYSDLWKRWQAPNPEGGRSFSIPTWANLAVFPGGHDDPEIVALRGLYPEDIFLERFGARPRLPATTVFREFDHTKHVDFCPLLKDHPVQVWVDPGYAGAYAVLAVQVVDGFVYVLDEVYKQGWTAHQVIAECRGREWWDQVSGGVIDIAARQHHGQESQLEIWASYGVKLFSQKVGVADGILRHRTFLIDPETKEPRIRFDPKCVETIREYSLYRYRDVPEGRPVYEEPINANNHSMTALAYGLVACFGFVERRRQRVRAKFKRN